jgi:nucleoside diphosphate kinase
MRTTIGATNPADAEPGSIRGDLATSMPNNLVHGPTRRSRRKERSRCGSRTMSLV